MYKIIIPESIEKKLQKYSQIKERFYRKIELFKNNPQHPSLRFKAYKGIPNTFEISITISFRVLLEKMEEDTFLVLDLGFHDILDQYKKQK